MWVLRYEGQVLPLTLEMVSETSHQVSLGGVVSHSQS